MARFSKPRWNDQGRTPIPWQRANGSRLAAPPGRRAENLQNRRRVQPLKQVSTFQGAPGAVAEPGMSLPGHFRRFKRKKKKKSEALRTDVHTAGPVSVAEVPPARAPRRRPNVG